MLRATTNDSVEGIRAMQQQLVWKQGKSIDGKEGRRGMRRYNEEIHAKGEFARPWQTAKAWRPSCSWDGQCGSQSSSNSA